MAYEYQEYPKALYETSDSAPVIVQDRLEEAAVRAEWARKNPSPAQENKPMKSEDPVPESIVLPEPAEPSASPEPTPEEPAPPPFKKAYRKVN